MSWAGDRGHGGRTDRVDLAADTVPGEVRPAAAETGYHGNEVNTRQERDAGRHSCTHTRDTREITSLTLTSARCKMGDIYTAPNGPSRCICCLLLPSRRRKCFYQFQLRSKRLFHRRDITIADSQIDVSSLDAICTRTNSNRHDPVTVTIQYIG